MCAMTSSHVPWLLLTSVPWLPLTSVPWLRLRARRVSTNKTEHHQHDSYWQVCHDSDSELDVSAHAKRYTAAAPCLSPLLSPMLSSSQSQAFVGFSFYGDGSHIYTHIHRYIDLSVSLSLYIDILISLCLYLFCLCLYLCLFPFTAMGLIYIHIYMCRMQTRIECQNVVCRCV